MVHADVCAEAWMDPIEDPDEADDKLLNEEEPMEDATGTLREPKTSIWKLSGMEFPS